MNEDASDVYTYYYEADENGEPDFSRPVPVNKEQFIKDYLDNVDKDPDSLADLYLDFYNFSDIEFLVFKGNLSAAVLVSRAAKKSIATLESALKVTLREVSRTAKYAEDTMAVEQSLYVTEDAYQISIGATIVTAVAALETLLIDLAPDSAPRPRGLSNLLQAFLERYKVTKSQEEQIRKLGRKVARRRNTFAHTLTGSYFDKDKSVAAMFTPETMEDTLYTVGTIAVMMDKIVSP